MTVTVPPISELTHSCVPAGLKMATRGRLSTSTLSKVLCDVVSMKWAMLVVSDVLTSTLPSGLMPMPSGSTPTGMSPRTLPLLDVDDGDEVVVLVGDVQRIAGGMQDEQLGVGAGRQRLHHLKGLGVVDLDDVVVAGADDQPLAVVRQDDAARALADGEGLDHLELLGVDDRDRVVLLVGDERRKGQRRGRRQGECGTDAEQRGDGEP